MRERLLHLRAAEVEVAVLAGGAPRWPRSGHPARRAASATRLSTSSDSTMISISPVGSVGLTRPSGRARTCPVTEITHSPRELLRSSWALRRPRGRRRAGEAVAVAQVDEDQAAVVAAAGDPAAERDLAAPACRRGARRTGVGAHRRGSDRRGSASAPIPGQPAATGSVGGHRRPARRPRAAGASRCPPRGRARPGSRRSGAGAVGQLRAGPSAAAARRPRRGRRRPPRSSRDEPCAPAAGIADEHDEAAQRRRLGRHEPLLLQREEDALEPQPEPDARACGPPSGSASPS